MRTVHKALVVVHRMPDRQVKYVRMVREASFKKLVEQVCDQSKFLWKGLVTINGHFVQVYGYTHNFMVPPTTWSDREEING